jgi:hypothetical protein
VTAPTIYLISRTLTEEQINKVREALFITPLAAVVICDPRDADLAKNFSDTVTSLQQPIAVVADFDTPLTAVDENGSLCPLL